MKNVGKFFLISVGGLVALMVLGMVVGVIFNTDPKEIKSIDLIREWMWYRIGFYVIVVAGWEYICRFMTRQRHADPDNTPEENQEILLKRENDIQYLKSQRWKIVLLMAFFEIVIIQQFGL